MQKNRVVVTGLGVITPLGNDVPTFWSALKSGKSGAGPITSFDTSGFDSRIAAEVKGFDPILYGISVKDVRRLEKFVQYAVASSKQAIADASLNLDKENIGVIYTSGDGLTAFGQGKGVQCFVVVSLLA